MLNVCSLLRMYPTLSLDKQAQGNIKCFKHFTATSHVFADYQCFAAAWPRKSLSLILCRTAQIQDVFPLICLKGFCYIFS